MLLGAVLSARADIAMQPMIAHVTVHRGMRQTFDIAVANSGETDFRCHLGSVDIYPGRNGNASGNRREASARLRGLAYL